MTDLATELLLALEIAIHAGADELAVHRQLDRVEQAMADAIAAAFSPDDEPLEAAA